MILSFIDIGKVPLEELKPRGFPPDLANVNEWNIMIDPSISCFSVRSF